jgi:chemotaxis signal transduction protein
MAARTIVRVDNAEHIQFLLFTVQDICCGIDSAQIGRMMHLAEAENHGMELEWIDRRLSFGEEYQHYRKPVVLTRAGAKQEVGMVVDQAEDFISLPILSIFPLPAIFEKWSSKCFWGALLRNERIVLLVDFHKLLDNC